MTPRLCSECGKRFKTPPHSTALTCSLKCRRARKNRLDRERRTTSHLGDDMTCPQCGRTVTRTSAAQVTCLDPICQQERWAAMQADIRRERRKYEGGQKAEGEGEGEAYPLPQVR